jgi:hypothetical protein
VHVRLQVEASLAPRKRWTVPRVLQQEMTAHGRLKAWGLSHGLGTLLAEGGWNTAVGIEVVSGLRGKLLRHGFILTGNKKQR